jgi:hypothetical protein
MEHAAVRLYASPRLTHDRRTNGIHLFTFYESSRPALDEWFTRLHSLYTAYGQDRRPILLLIDSSACGTQPLGYAYQEARKFQAQFDYHPVVYTAFVERSLVMVRALDAFIHLLHTTPYSRYFTPDGRAEAMAWLESALTP